MLRARLVKLLASFLLFISLYILVAYYISQYPQTSVVEISNRNSTSFHTYTTNVPCHPKRGILLAKTHKTAGSTIGTIIARYGYERNLTFALPAKSHIMGYDVFTENMLLRKPPQDGFDILINHVRFQKSSMGEIMSSNAKYVTVLREPVSRWYSTVEYYSLWKVAYSKKEYEERAKSFNIDDFLFKISQCNSFKCRLGQDGQLFDLGFMGRSTGQEGMDLVKAKIKQLQNEFDLVLIAEYFDESLLLLKKMMCWDFRDIVYIKKKQSRRSRKKPYGEAAAIRNWNEGDVLLYEHFNKTLWMKMEKYGPKFDDDLRYFQNLNTRVIEVCGDPSSSHARAIGRDIFKDSLRLEDTCDNLKRDIRPYTKLLVEMVLRNGK